ncbi:amino acid ABC transporter permease [Neobacillus sp. LXY-1]|uniref:amino acid ABC transporter permease n=1 Tax=Neobacillus sp. LXY-1 TaxID=3379133 RepID=UPI003EE1AA38
MLDFSLVQEYVPFLLKASVTTLEIFICSIALGLVMGVVIVIMKISKFKPLSLFANFYIWTLRGTPLLVQLFLVYFGFPQIGVELAPFPASVLALGINAGAYIAEILRGGILSIPKGQMEAAQSLGLSYPTIMRRIIFPQAFRVSIPAIGNEAITLLKDSSLASLVTVSELMMTSQRFAASNYAFIEFYITAALIYLILTTILSFFLSKVELKLSISEH